MPKKSLSVRTDLVHRPPPPDENISGKEFGQWKVLEYAGSKQGRWYRCRCSCGYIAVVHGGELKGGRSLSCGHDGSTYRHGHGSRAHEKRPAEYNVWVLMRDRCNNTNSRHYKNYGGRGIKVCERWDDFAAFLADMGPRPSPQHTIDRINNDGNYEPSNCRWATRAEQARNKRTNIQISHNGTVLCLAEWCKKLNLPYLRSYRRLRNGESVTAVFAEKGGQPSHDD